MTHVATHCGSAGRLLGEPTIKVYAGSVLSYALHWEKEGMREYDIPEWAIEEFGGWLWEWREQLVKKLVHMGIPYTIHQPHPENNPP